MNIVTDTHPWIWFLTANPRLSPKTKALLLNPSNLIIIPSIVTLEIKYLYNRKRIPLSFTLLWVAWTNSFVRALPTRINKFIHATLPNVKCGIRNVKESFNSSLRTPHSELDRAISGSGLVPVIWYGKDTPAGSIDVPDS